ncbi:hypothetical protein HGRIS_012676 [Hohenbuehelia grisea]|uniref:Uncharacterized protein n=1 Tax=Hohenbuehelia grisea TaxID=104357 RepID=A0ABR3IT58_9AGAR
MDCVQTPTATQTETITTESASVSTTSSITTLPDSTSTRVVTTCLSSAVVSGTGTPGCLVSTEITSTTVIPGGATTIQVPITVNVPVTQTHTTTLLGSSCSSSSSSVPPQPPSSVSSVLSVSTPPPQVIQSESSSTLADGSVFVSTILTTSTLPPTSIFLPTTVPNAAQQTQQSNDDGSSAPLGPIIGGVVGGFFGLMALIAIGWFIVKRKSRWDDIFDKDDGESGEDGSRRFSLSTEIEPKPYQYGLVGHTPSPQPGSPPTSPPLGAGHQRGRSSIAPLTLSPSTGMTSGPPTISTGMASLSSRPSSAGSTQPLRAPSAQGIQANELGVRPPSVHSHSQSSSISQPPVTFANWNQSPTIPPMNFGGALAGAGVAGGMVAADQANDPHMQRTGSPVSVYEPVRRLQLVNGVPTSPAQSVHHRGMSNDTVMSVAQGFGAAAAASSSAGRPSNASAGPSANASSTGLEEFDPYSAESVDASRGGMTRTNTKGQVILSPPREVRVAQDGGRAPAPGPSRSNLPNSPPAYEA